MRDVVQVDVRGGRGPQLARRRLLRVEHDVADAVVGVADEVEGLRDEVREALRLTLTHCLRPHRNSS